MGLLTKFLVVASLASCLEAGTYWVSPTGAAAWAACQSASPLSGTAACARTTANTNAAAGDTIYFRGGTYSITGFNDAIIPTNSGTNASNRITFARYGTEVPIMLGDGSQNGYGLYFNGKSYIKIDGITFQNLGTWAYLINSSSHNEVVNCTFASTTQAGAAGSGFFLNSAISCPGFNCWNTHNWIHSNTFYGRISPSGACTEGADLMRIGQAYGSGNTTNLDNYNTVEDNVFYWAAHTILDNWGMYTVIRNNLMHNEPWITGCTTYQKSTSSTSLTIPTVPSTTPYYVQITLTTQTGLSYASPQPIGVISANDSSKAMGGTVFSYNSSTGDLVVRVYSTSGSGTDTSWILSQNNAPYYENAAYNGLYGHRNLQLDDDYARGATYDLVEGNRIGHASTNPNNSGADGLDLAAPRNIVRYNQIFNSMASGIYFKYANSAWYTGTTCTASRTGNNGACGGQHNRVYNNTVYHNGHGYNAAVYLDTNTSANGEGIAQWDANGTGPTGNIIKNNIVYDNGQGDICTLGLHVPPPYTVSSCATQSWDTVSQNWLTPSGDPKFRNPSLTDPGSLSLPDLALASSSPAVDQGTYLTQAVGAGAGSTTLVVGDAMYFQDGTWGSDLARGVNFFPDWIAIGTVSNVVQINSINYATNTITLASPMTWSDGAPVWLYSKSDGQRVIYGAAPDIGASECVAQPRMRTRVIPPAAPTPVAIPPASVTSNAATGTFTINTAPQSANGIQVVCFDAQASSLPTVTGVVGSRNGAYTLIKRSKATDGYSDVYAYYATNTSASAETVTITMSSSSYWMAMVSFQAQNVNAVTPIGATTASGIRTTGTGADINTADNTSGSAGDAIVACTGNYYAVTTWAVGATNPASMAVIGSRNDNHSDNLGVAATVLGPAGYTGVVGLNPGTGVADYGATVGFTIRGQ